MPIGGAGNGFRAARQWWSVIIAGCCRRTACWNATSGVDVALYNVDGHSR
jgi:hypothetical protein